MTDEGERPAAGRTTGPTDGSGESAASAESAGSAEPAESGDLTESSPGSESDAEFAPDPETVAFLREIAEDIRGDSSESRQIAAILYRVSDLYDPEEDTSPEEIYLNVRNILEVKERGGIDR